MDRARVYAALLDAGAELGGDVSMGLVRSLAGLEWRAFNQAALELYAHGVVDLVQGPAPCAVTGTDGDLYAYMALVPATPPSLARNAQGVEA